MGNDDVHDSDYSKDLGLLQSLNKKLHYVHESTFTPNLSGDPFPVYIDQYTKKSMTKEEVKGLLKVIKKGNFVFAPINTSMGFQVGFMVVNPETKKSLLKFEEIQLPKNYGFGRLSKYFMASDNLKRAEKLEIEIVNDRDHYDY